MSNDSSVPSGSSSGDDLARPSALSTSPDPLALLRAFRRRWRVALPVAAVCAIIFGFAAWLIVPPSQYSVRSLIRIPPGNTFLFRTSEPVPLLQDHQRNQMAMLKSRLVLNNVLKDKRTTNLTVLRDKPDPIQWLERELQADFSVAPEVMRIMLVGDEADELRVLVNVIREIYKSEVLDKERADRSERLTMLQRQKEKYESLLRSRKEEQRKFEQVAGGRDANTRGLVQAFTQQQLNFFERELMTTQSEVRRAHADLAIRNATDKNADTAPVADTTVDEQLAKEPVVQAARNGIQQLQSLLEETAKVAQDGERSPKALEIRRKIAEAEDAMSLLRKRLAPQIVDEVKQRSRMDAARSLQQLQTRIAFLEEEEKVLNTVIDKLRISIKEKAESVAKAEAEREDMANLEETTKRIAVEAAALEFELQAPDRYRLLEDAVATKPADNKRGLLIAGGAGITGFAAVLLLFAFLEFRARRIDAPDDFVIGLGLPLVGSLPDTSSRASRRQPGSGDPSILDEAVNTVRTMILRAAEHDALRVILITSAQSGEGKTSLSTHLAASLAQVGYTTLLIDGDLRHPIAHKVFNLERGPGLCDLLRLEATLDDVIRPTRVNRMFMITAGHWDGGATRALAQNGARDLIAELRTRFDFVIIDSSPVLPVVDPLLLGQNSDGAILSVLRDVSRMPSIFAAYQRLEAGGVRVMGAVMSGVRSDYYGEYYPYVPQVDGADQPVA